MGYATELDIVFPLTYANMFYSLHHNKPSEHTLVYSEDFFNHFLSGCLENGKIAPVTLNQLGTPIR